MTLPELYDKHRSVDRDFGRTRCTCMHCMNSRLYATMLYNTIEKAVVRLPWASEADMRKFLLDALAEIDRKIVE
jgi:hypothetical protein